MTPTKYYLDSLYRCTKADHDLFRRWTDFLSRRDGDENIPYHSGAHNLQRFRMAYELLRPRSILEIGFNLGHSSVMWLELGVKKVHSMDIAKTEKAMASAAAIDMRYPNRFSISWENTRLAELKGEFDLGFIDGSHEREWVCTDIGFCLRHGIRQFFMDDYDSHHGPGVVEAVAEWGLVPRAIFGTMAWCSIPDGFEQRSDPYQSK